MKACVLFAMILFPSCGSEINREDQVSSDTIRREQASDYVKVREKDTTSTQIQRTFNNERFKDVRVERTGEQDFRVTGKAQIFEASFSWVVEDGHEELQSGYEMTDAGAPEWGNFDFTINTRKKGANSTLHLILFESSPKDGSRQYELPILLY